MIKILILIIKFLLGVLFRAFGVIFFALLGMTIFSMLDEKYWNPQEYVDVDKFGVFSTSVFFGLTVVPIVSGLFGFFITNKISSFLNFKFNSIK
jgi:hypothetical protein